MDTNNTDPVRALDEGMVERLAEVLRIARARVADLAAWLKSGNEVPADLPFVFRERWQKIAADIRALESALASAPPIAPVGVDAKARRLYEMIFDAIAEDGSQQAEDACIRAIASALSKQPADVDGMVMVQASDLKTLAEFADRGMRGNQAKLAALRAKAILASQQPAAQSGAAASAEPAVWVAADTLNSPHPTCISSLAYMSQLDRERGREYVPLYAAPQQPVGVTEEMVERAGQALYGTDWGSFERWEADQLKRKVRAVLTAALQEQETKA